MSKVADLVEVTEKGAGDAILESGAVHYLRELCFRSKWKLTFDPIDGDQVFLKLISAI